MGMALSRKLTPPLTNLTTLTNRSTIPALTTLTTPIARRSLPLQPCWVKTALAP